MSRHLSRHDADSDSEAHETALATPDARALTSRPRRLPANVDASSPPSTPTQPSRRRRKLPPMTSGQRARYYRHIHATENEALEQTTVLLRREVDRLECRLGLSRQLVGRTVSHAASLQIMEFVSEFVYQGIHTSSIGLRNPAYEIQSVLFHGDTYAPVVRVDALASGRLTTAVVHAIYPCVLGDSTILDALIHEPIRYICSFVFFFSSDGVVERETIEISTITGLRVPLRSLTTVARVVAQVNVLPDVDRNLEASST